MNSNHPRLSIRNLLLGIGNGAILQLGQAALDPETVLTAFALTLFDGSVVAVGILASVISSGWYLPEAFIAPLLARRKRLLPVYRISAAARVVAILGLWAVVRFVGVGRPALLLALVALCLLSYTTSGGFGLVPFYSIVSDTIPPTWRGRFFGARWFLGGLLGFGAGFFVKHVLSKESGLAFPDNCAHLFLLAAIALAASTGFFCLAKEEPRTAQKRSLPFRTELARGPRFFKRDPNFRRATRARALFTALSGLSFYFIVPYAIMVSNMSIAVAGLYLSMKMLAQSVSNLLWSRMSDRDGSLRVLRVSGWLTVLVVAATLAGPLVPQTPLSGWLSSAVDARVAYYLLVGALVGVSRGGAFMGHDNYLLEVSPVRVRTTYLGFYYAVMFPLCWVPFFGSLVIGAQQRYVLVFCVAAVLGVLMMVDLLRLSEVRGEAEGEPEKAEES